MAVEPVIWLDGRFVSGEDLGIISALSYGAYTSFRVENGAVWGLDLHLDRLSTWAVALFGGDIDRAAIMQGVVSALAGQGEAWVKLNLFSQQLTPRTPEAMVTPSVLISISSAPSPLAHGRRCLAVEHSRYQPEIKHVATFDLIHARRQARLKGYDDAVLIDAQGRLTEGSTWNVGFVRGDQVVWPQGRMLDGVAQILIKRGLDQMGLVQSYEAIDLSALQTFDAAFLCNSATPCASIASINDAVFDARHPLLAKAAEAWHLGAPMTLSF